MRIAVVALLLIAGLAGCVGSDTQTQSVDDDNSATPLVAAEAFGLEARQPANASDEGIPTIGRELDDGAVLLTVTGDTPTAGYVYSIPSDAAHKYSGSWEAVTLNIAPKLNGELHGATVTIHDMATGTLLTGAILFPFNTTEWSFSTTGTEGTLATPLEPMVFWLPDDYAGKEVGVVVATNGLVGELGFAVAATDHQWGDEPDGFQQTGRGGVLTPAPNGTAGEAQFDAFIRISQLMGVSAIEATSGEYTFENDLPDMYPLGGAHDWTLGIDKPDAGWTYNIGLYIGCEGAVDWRVESTSGDYKMQDAGAMTCGRGPGWTGSALAFGLPVFFSEGDGPSSMEMKSVGAFSNELLLLAAYTLSYDQPLEHLLGVTGQTNAFWFGGLVDVPWPSPLTQMPMQVPAIDLDGAIAQAQEALQL